MDVRRHAPLCTGQERDAETNLDFFHARYMSAAQGRFLSTDPFNAGADPMDPQSWNGYSYVRNSPLNLVDPSGMDPFDPGDPGDCADDPFCGWTYWPPIIFPPIGDEPIPQIPAPPPPPTPIAIQNMTGVYAQGQWGGTSGSDILRNGPSPAAAAQVKQTYLDFILGLQIWWHGRPTGAQPTDSVRAWAIRQTAPVHGLWTYGNWCGEGGSGAPIDQHDGDCMTHDYCYAQSGLSAGDNRGSLPADKQAALQKCNQVLCDSEASIGGVTSLQIRGYFILGPKRGAACR